MGTSKERLGPIRCVRWVSDDDVSPERNITGERTARVGHWQYRRCWIGTGFPAAAIGIVTKLLTIFPILTATGT